LVGADRGGQVAERRERALVELALGVSVAQAAGARELLEALRGRDEVGWRPNEDGVVVGRVDVDLRVLKLVGERPFYHIRFK